MREFQEQWNNLTQGKREVREYLNEIERLVRKFPKMTERTVILKFLYGLNPKIRGLMIPINADPKEDILSFTVKAAGLAKSQLE